ncbi:LysR family transcriptional regulator [Parashewanella curva]|uniref:LysR family transcriptional regulator n=1 Tax=Parashewanella curva TaxID=2338552 RepID=A0A3L8PVK2_9GAMM|nr:LysR family transcriptional regulator [Parashewanella curva]RLV58458.1 LysR family transcriptional regulator [Parashewanella curva]
MGTSVAIIETKIEIMKTEDISLFHRIVESGGINETANLLSIPKSTVSRRLKALEEELNIKLFHRSGRELALTTAGGNFYQASLTTLKELEQVICDLSHEHAPLTGNLRIQVFPIPKMPTLFNIVLAFMELHPQLDVEIFTSPEPLDMIKYNLDVAFRIDKQIENANLIARPLFESKIHFYASQAYIDAHGAPNDITEMPEHNFIVYRFLDSSAINELPEIDNIAGVKIKGNIHTNNISFARQAALAGKGIVCLPEEYAKQDVSDGKLIRLLSEVSSFTSQYNIVYPSRSFLSLSASKFIDFVLQEIDKLSIEEKERIPEERQWL